MNTSIRQSTKSAIILLFTSLLLLLPPGTVNADGIADEINSLAERVKITGDAFMHESFQLRLKYEHSGGFPSEDDRENLYKLTKNAGDNLQVIAETQKTLKSKIEGYQGPDWEDRYGASGLWRKLFTDLYATILSKCQVDFYLALTMKPPQKNKLLLEIITQIDSLDTKCRSVDSRFLKAKAAAEIAKTGLIYKPSAIHQLDSFITQFDVPETIYFRAAIEKIKLLGQTEPGQLNTLADKFSKSSCTDDIELALSLAFLQRESDPNAFEKSVRAQPQTKDFLGFLLLSDISNKISQAQSLQQITVFEAELAAQAARKNKLQDHKTLMEYLTNTEKFRTPLILYVTGLAFAESSPAKAVNLLIEASKAQQLQKSDKLNIDAEQIARQAAQLAYNIFIAEESNNKQSCATATEAFENYLTMACNKINGEMKYSYSIILNNCGQPEKGKELLQKIAARPSGHWQNRAKLDLIILSIQQKQPDTQNTSALEQLSNLIADCEDQDKDQSDIRAEAITIYCQLLLESKDRANAKKALDVLTEVETLRNPNLNLFKSKALRYLGKLDESAKSLLKVVDPNRCEHLGEAMELLSQVIDEIDNQQTSDNKQLMENSKKLARLCYNCLDGAAKQQAALHLSEISIVAAHSEKDKLSEAEKLLDDLSKNIRDNNEDLVRCQARLLTEKGKFEQAAKLWAKICKWQKNDSPLANQQSEKWWQAKYYELYCWAKTPQTPAKDVLHTIEILESSYSDIPPLWAEKLSSLKQQCAGHTTKAGK